MMNWLHHGEAVDTRYPVPRLVLLAAFPVPLPAHAHDPSLTASRTGGA